MGIVKCFLSMVSKLRKGEVALTTSPLDTLIADYDHYAYVGNRRQLRRLVLALSSRLRVSGASIKPRLRIMSEVEKEGNPHTYGEIPARTVNLVVKPAVVEESSPETDWLSQSVAWFQGQASMEGVAVHHVDYHSIVLAFGGEVIPFSIRCIHHLRNGKHLVLQCPL